MTKKALYIPLAILALFVSLAFITQEVYTSNSSIVKVLMDQGVGKPLHYLGEIDEEKRKAGEDLFINGRAIIDGKMTSRISKHYECISCHNNVIEEQFLSSPGPESRVSFAKEKGIPFLQGTSLYGTVNRKTWYNGDYEKKYGSLVISSRDTLANAIQLCAEVCSQGRRLSEGELEAFMHYFWSLEYTLEDLGITPSELEKQTDKVAFIESKYLNHSPATFVKAISYDDRKLGEGADATVGETIYKQSCMHCHSAKSSKTNLKLDEDILSYKYLAKATKKHSPESIYRIVRGGTYPIEGYKPYMPHYTKERLSDQQVEDLVAFILSKASSNE